MHILWWAIVGLIAGWAAGKIMKGAGYGVLMDIIVGIARAMLGGFLTRVVGFAGEGTDLHRYCCHRRCCDPHRNSSVLYEKQVLNSNA
jgi:uncharacterized membrane protein YeaQ/YmgE (transglycosylase-associated protein family)